MKRFITSFVLVFIMGALFAENGTLTVTSVESTPVTGITVITYDLTAQTPDKVSETYNISVEVSFEGGVSGSYIPVPSAHLSGDVEHVAPGTGRQITWDGGAGFPNRYSEETKVRLTAMLIAVQTYALSMEADPSAGGTSTDQTNGGPYEENAVVNIKAEPNFGYEFVNWTAPSGSFGNALAMETTFIMPSGNVTVTANFQKDPSSGTFTDSRDGQTYKWVKIGDQVWMAENLKYISANSWCYDGDDYDYFWCDYYGSGRLYTWAAVMNGAPSSNTNPSGVQGVCPPGWHVPSHEEWTQLEQYVCTQLGNSDCANSFPYDTNAASRGERGTNEGNALKSCRQVGSPLGGDCNTSDYPRWESHSTNYGTDVFGFSAHAGGFRWDSGSFGNIGVVGFWWSATETLTTWGDMVWTRQLIYYNGFITRPPEGSGNHNNGYSVRCVKDPD